MRSAQPSYSPPSHLAVYAVPGAGGTLPVVTNPSALQPVAASRPSLGDMTDSEFDSWVNMARAGLSEMITFVQSYLDRRVARGTNTGTDLAYRRYIVLLHDLLQAMGELDALRAGTASSGQAHSNLTGMLLMYDNADDTLKP